MNAYIPIKTKNILRLFNLKIFNITLLSNYFTIIVPFHSFNSRQLHDVKTIDDYFCIREACLSDTKHAVGEIHSNLSYCKALFLRKFQQLPGYFFYGCTFDCTYKRSMLSMSFLIGKKSI